MLVQQSESPLALMHLIKAMRTAMRDAGFQSFRTLPFPQPCYPTGWWSCTIARKGADFDGFREGDAQTKPFDTQYYNVDIHKAALAIAGVHARRARRLSRARRIPAAVPFSRLRERAGVRALGSPSRRFGCRTTPTSLTRPCGRPLPRAGEAKGAAPLWARFF